MKCEIEYTDEFGEWWESLNEDEQDSVTSYVKLLELDPIQKGVSSTHHNPLRGFRQGFSIGITPIRGECTS